MNEVQVIQSSEILGTLDNAGTAMQSVTMFSFNGANVRVKRDSAGEPMFCLSDVCNVLDIANVSNCKARLNTKGTHITATLTPGGVQQMTFISEQNLYKVIFQSRKPEAEKFADWVTGELLPAIRKNGGYMIAKPEESPEELCLRAMNILQETVARQKAQLAAQSEQLKLQAPEVEYCRSVLSINSLMTVNTIAAHLKVSAKRLNAFLDGEGWIYRQGRCWYPSCKIRNSGYCDYDTVKYTNSAGEECSTHHLKWTEKGRRAVIELWNKRHMLNVLS